MKSILLDIKFKGNGIVNFDDKKTSVEDKDDDVEID